MANAPGLGPTLRAEQELAIEVAVRFAHNAPREQVAQMMRRLYFDNLMLREALMELLGED